MGKNDDPVHGFMKKLIDMAIRSAMQSIFWKMPLIGSIIALIVLVLIAYFFKLM